MIIEFDEADESRVRWNSGGEWKSADIDELIAAYERKQGKWIIDQYGWAVCSNCNAIFGTILRQIRYKHCPNCGAKMEDTYEDN